MKLVSILDELTRLDILLDVTIAGRLRVDAPVGVVTEPLREALKERRDELVGYCRRRDADQASPDSLWFHRNRGLKNAPEWLEKHAWVAAVDLGDLPRTPFYLNSEAKVTDAEVFLRALQADVERGPEGPRARTGALQEDCRNLWEIIIAENRQN